MSEIRELERAMEGARVRDLADYFPATAAGKHPVRKNEVLVEAGDLLLVGPGDGSVVPIAAENLESMPENLWDFDKLLTLCDAASGSPGQYTVDMGYGDVTLEHGELVAQVRDGNHRTFAAALCGAEFVPVMISDNVMQGLKWGENDALYRAVRKAQREAGLPQLTRRRAAPKNSAASALAAAEQDLLDAADRELAAQGDFLRHYGFVEGGYDHANQLERAYIFWKEKAREIGWVALRDDPIIERIHAAHEARMAALEPARAARKAAGLDPYRQRLDPRTGKVVNG